MPGRILTLQRQARELGRLRAGITEKKNGRTFPARSKNWVLTAKQKDYLDNAAGLWGGTVEAWTPQGSKDSAWRLITDTEAIDAILPPGDPLSQTYELWSRGGCQRRCDGVIEQLSGSACVCREDFGDDFHQQPPDQACRPHTRLNVILPDLPDLGVWRMETKSFYAANEIVAGVDLIQHATGGKLAVPVRLRIEQRKRVAQGQTKNFPVIVVEIRGATAGQILSGQPQTVALAGGQVPEAIGPGGSDARALTAGSTAAPIEFTAEKALAAIGAAKTLAQLDMVRQDCQTAGLRDQRVVDAWSARSAELATPKEGTPAAETPVEGDIEPDPDAVWSQINAHVGKNQKWPADDLEQRVIKFLGKSSIDASGFELETFLTALRNGEVA